jgi:hypothetical protein
MVKNRTQQQLDSLMATYNLHSVINFPTRITRKSTTAIDNLFINKSMNSKFTILPVINELLDHDAQLLILHNIKMTTTSAVPYIKRIINDITISGFNFHLSYENWENVFRNNDVDTIFNNFLNTYLKIFYHCCPLKKLHQTKHNNEWIMTGTKISSLDKRDLHLLSITSNDPKIISHYKKYCKVFVNVIKTTKRLHYNKKN